MSQECNCDTPKVSIPLRGIELSFDADAFGNGGSGGGSFNLVTDGPEVAIPGEYWAGKQVYAKQINFGALPNDSQKSKAHNIDHMDLFCVDESRSWVVDGVGNHRGLSRPTTSHYNYYVNNSAIYISTSFNASSYYATVTLLYTKTTDEPIA